MNRRQLFAVVGFGAASAVACAVPDGRKPVAYMTPGAQCAECFHALPLHAQERPDSIAVIQTRCINRDCGNFGVEIEYRPFPIYDK